MIATINEILFPFFLFTVFFCTASILLYNEKKQLQASESNNSTAFESNSQVEKIGSNCSTDMGEQFPKEIPLTREIQDAANEYEPPNPFYAKADQIISHLNKRQSRKICKPLGIQQKCGKEEKSLTFIKAEIRSLFKDEPERVIAAIKEKLPELICYPRQASEQAAKIAS